MWVSLGKDVILLGGIQSLTLLVIYWLSCQDGGKAGGETVAFTLKSEAGLRKTKAPGECRHKDWVS